MRPVQLVTAQIRGDRDGDRAKTGFFGPIPAKMGGNWPKTPGREPSCDRRETQQTSETQAWRAPGSPQEVAGSSPASSIASIPDGPLITASGRPTRARRCG